MPEIAEIIGADSLGYLSVDSARRMAGCGCPESFCLGCFTGKYPTEVPETPQKNRFERKISEREDA